MVKLLQSKKLVTPRPYEENIQKSIIQVLESIGHWCQPNGVCSKRNIRRTGFGPGSPDLLVITRKTNIAIWLEVKRDEKEKLRKDQKIWHANAKIRGIWVYLVWSSQMAIEVVEETEKLCSTLRVV